MPLYVGSELFLVYRSSQDRVTECLQHWDFKMGLYFTLGE